MKTYYWKDGEVHVINQQLYWNDSKKNGCIECYTLDEYRTNPEARYGMFSRLDGGGWKSIPFDEFPAEFKTALLLLGVQP